MDRDSGSSDDEHTQEKSIRAQAPKAKKRVGRPRKTIERRDIVHEGVVHVPSNLNDVTDESLVYTVRLLYENPHMFKNIFNLFKHMKSDSVSIRFEKDRVKMFTWDKLKTSRIYVEIDGNKMNSYYCEKTLDLQFRVENPKKRLQSLSKENTEIQITANRRWEKERIEMTLRNETNSMRGVDNINVDLPEDVDWHVEEDIANEKYYPIKFEMIFKTFKDTISNISLMLSADGKFSIEKTGLEQLRFCYNYDDSLGDHDEYFEDSGKINLRSSVGENYPFAAPVFVERVKLLAGSLISDVIHISVDEKKDLIFTMYLDQEEDENKKLIPGTEKAYIKVLTRLAELPPV
jgi:intracellular sulfur oxidation DsrE/DsrF family protein